MEITWLQAGIFAAFASVAGIIGAGGQPYGWYTLSRPLVASAIVGLVMGDIRSAIMLGAAIQVAYIAIVTPGGAVPIDLRSISWIGVPLSLVAVRGAGLEPNSPAALSLAVSIASTVGIVGMVGHEATQFVHTAVWLPIGLKAIKDGDTKKIYMANIILPILSHVVVFIPVLLVLRFGAGYVANLKEMFPMESIFMKTLYMLGAVLTTVGIGVLLKQTVQKAVDFIPFLFGFALAAALGINLIGATLIALMIALIFYEIRISKISGSKQEEI